MTHVRITMIYYEAGIARYQDKTPGIIILKGIFDMTQSRSDKMLWQQVVVN